MKIDFTDIKSALISIQSHLKPDCIVSFCWDGTTLSVVAAKPSTDMLPWHMTFDSEDDFDLDPDVLVKQFTDGAKAYFGSAAQQADYLNSLLRQAAEK